MNIITFILCCLFFIKLKPWTWKGFEYYFGLFIAAYFFMVAMSFIHKLLRF